VAGLGSKQQDPSLDALVAAQVASRAGLPWKAWYEASPRCSGRRHGGVYSRRGGLRRINGSRARAAHGQHVRRCGRKDIARHAVHPGQRRIQTADQTSTGFAFAPSAMHSARSTGFGGFHLSIEGQLHHIDADAPYVKRAPRVREIPIATPGPPRTATRPPGCNSTRSSCARASAWVWS